MRKLLSILLVCAMFVSVTAFATEYPTECYFKLDFEDYSGIPELATNLRNDSEFKDYNAATVLGVINRSGQDEEGFNGEALNYSLSVNKTISSFKTNTFGKKSLLTNGSDSSGTKGSMLILPKKSWNYEENPSEMYVISFDVNVTPMGISVADTDMVHTYWVNSEKNSLQPIKTFYTDVFGKADDNGNIGALRFLAGNQNNGAERKYIKDLNTKRIIFGYSYKEENFIPGINEENPKVTEKFSDTPYYFPSRYYSINGGNWDTKNISNVPYTAKWSNGSVTHFMAGGRQNISAIKLGWTGAQNLEYADILVYTIKNKDDQTSFKVSMEDDTVELGDSAYVKFSYPIAPSTFTKESITIYEIGDGGERIPFDTYEIGKFSNVLKEDGELYSLAEIIFPYGTKAETTYEIEFNTTGKAVKNEIGWFINSTDADGDSINDNVTSFTTGAKPNNTVSLKTYSGIGGGSDEVSSLTPQQFKFTAKAESSDSDKPAYLFIGVFDQYDNLKSYTYTVANTGDEISLGTKVSSGDYVKAFSCGNLYDLSDVFSDSTSDGSEIN